MSFAALAFLNPWLLAALATLPVIYWLLRAVPPRPARVAFPPTRILVGLEHEEKTADKTPWWLTLLRLIAATLVILALAEPVLNPSRDAMVDADGPMVVVVDNGWTAAPHWQDRVQLISRLIGEAERDGRSVIVAGTASATPTFSLKLDAPADARSTAAALAPQPFAPKRLAAITAIDAVLKSADTGTPSIVWLHDGVDHDGKGADVMNQLAERAPGGRFAVVEQDVGTSALGLAAKTGEKGRLEAVILSTGAEARAGRVAAVSARGQRLGEAVFNIAAGSKRAVATFDLPLELRNQVARIEMVGARSAGAVSLIDSATQWHRIGLISGQSSEQSQPLLAPLYYIQRALSPYAELAVSREANLSESLEHVLRQNVSGLMLADIGTISGEANKGITGFVERGGLLVRFAGPRLEKAGDDLLPVTLRSGGRSLGGALSWSTPQTLSEFDDASPFAGLTIPDDIKINRQVLADPAQLDGTVEVWARLADGTPLVTASKRGEGRIVLFHITANSDWSNVPMSGLFVEMLRRLSTMGRIGASADPNGGTTGEATADTDAEDTVGNDTAVTLPPLKTLNGLGTLVSPPPLAEPIAVSEFSALQPSAIHPPGYYGASAHPQALNVLKADANLAALPQPPAGTPRLNYQNAASTPLKPWLLAIALGLLFIDILAVVLLQAGGLAGLRRGGPITSAGARQATSAMLAFAITLTSAMTLFLSVSPADAQNRDRYGVVSERASNLSSEDAARLAATAKVTFGYVVTGDRDVDETSRLGLLGLSRVLESRTAVEPGEPAAIQIDKDEIGFYPIIYWPVIEDAEALPDPVISKIDAYMKEGGLVIFDTRDYGRGGNAVALSGPSGSALQRLLSKLDVPRLEPVPENHVVTKSFYLLRTFPGRWDGGQLWVEAIRADDEYSRRARVSDGVTSIMITANDLAAAWALDQRGMPLYQVVPGGERQREMAFRSGVNIVMHALTGNYKADQVHVPALLERLGN